MIWSNHSIRHPKHRIDTSCVDANTSYLLPSLSLSQRERSIRNFYSLSLWERAENFHLYFTSLTSSDPFSLHIFDSFWPIHIINIFFESVCVFGDREYPLSEFFLFYGSSTSFMRSIIENFFICDSCHTFWTKVDRKVLLIRKSCFKHFCKDPLRPFKIFWICGIYFSVPIV